MGGEVGGSTSKTSESGTSTANAPPWLQSFLEQATGTASSGLAGLQRLISGGDLVAGFDPLQQQGQQAAIDVAGGAGGFLPTAEQFFLEGAQGKDLSSFLPPEVLASLTGTATGQTGAMNRIDPAALQALRESASGAHLYGGEGFDRAVQAATNAATPAIRSVFGSSAGGLSGIGARHAVGQSASDAVASQYGNERERQLRAAGLLADVGVGDANRSTDAGRFVAGLGDAERSRSFDAARMLPEIGLLRSNILRGVGGERQDLAQQMRDRPIEMQMALIQAALQGIPLEQLIGRDTTGSSRTTQFGVRGGT